MKPEIRTKLFAARTRLVLERPFIGSLLMHLALAEASASDCPTVATDARSVYFNPDYIASLTLAETQFVLAHEALHCALAHFARRSHRIVRRWDVACDHAVNLMLIEDGMRAPPGILANPEFLRLSAEEIYPLIAPDTLAVPLDRHLFGPAPPASGITEQGLAGRRSQLFAGQANQTCEDARQTRSGGLDVSPEGCDGADPPHGTEAHRQRDLPVLDGHVEACAAATLAELWQSRLASAAQAAIQAGRLSDSIARALGNLIQPRVPWRSLLARFLMSVARDDYSFQRSARRDGEALLPRLASGGISLVVALDTSGSISEEDMREFASEVDALKGQIQANLVLHACDDRLCADGPWRFAPWDPVRLPNTLSGRGGTRFTPIFEWIEREQLCPDLLVYFTDAQGEFPSAAPPYPVIWLVKGRAAVPWGERVQLN
jgi:predicted metal-dependent peptidase